VVVEAKLMAKNGLTTLRSFGMMYFDDAQVG